MPCRAEKPAYSAMLIGPLRFLTETSPVADVPEHAAPSAPTCPRSCRRRGRARRPARSARRCACSSGTGRPGGRLDADAADHASTRRAAPRPRSARSSRSPVRSTVNVERLARAAAGPICTSAGKSATGWPADGDDPVAGLQARALRRAARHDLADLGRDGRVPEVEAEARQQRAGLGQRPTVCRRSRVGAARRSRRRRARTSSAIGVAVHQLVEDREHARLRASTGLAVPTPTISSPDCSPARAAIECGVTSPMTGFSAGMPTTNSIQ